jgi:predicted nucleic-acid-binding protein
MIAADTNLVVRHLTHDDARQAAVVQRLFSAAEARDELVLLPQIVLCEVCWTLARRFGLDKEAIAVAVRGLLDDRTFFVQGRERVERALASYRRGQAEFSDYLIGQIAEQEGATTTYTFDRKLARSPGFELAK